MVANGLHLLQRGMDEGFQGDGLRGRISGFLVPHPRGLLN